MSLEIEIDVAEPGWNAVPDLRDVIYRAATRAHAVSGVRLAEAAELSVLLCDDATIRDLNRTWRGQNTSTNVLSFPASSPFPLAERPLLGDLAIALETTWREAEQEGKSLADHLSHLVVHGLLHLAGHDHLVAVEAEAMETLETRILATLGIADPYHGTEPLRPEVG